MSMSQQLVYHKFSPWIVERTWSNFGTRKKHRSNWLLWRVLWRFRCAGGTYKISDCKSCLCMEQAFEWGWHREKCDKSRIESWRNSGAGWKCSKRHRWCQTDQHATSICGNSETFSEKHFSPQLWRPEAKSWHLKIESPSCVVLRMWTYQSQQKTCSFLVFLVWAVFETPAFRHQTSQSILKPK